MAEALFWISAAFVTYHYAIYPLAVVALSRLRPAVVCADPSAWPAVSFIIAAYNEERVIDWKIRNTLALDYPMDRFELMVVSDGSDDHTAEIVRSFEEQGVVALHEPQRRGKTAALNRAVAHATGEILVFSDANNEFSRDAVRLLVRHFGDARVGGVCGAKRIKPAADRQSSTGDGLYWRYESAVKEAESRLGTISNADGEIFAVRRALYRPVAEHLINDDAAISLDVVSQGRRILYEPRAHSFELASLHIRDDFHVKVRMVAGGYQTLAENAAALFPFRSWFTWAFFSHKTLRWLAPLFLLVVLGTSAALAAQMLYGVAFAAQVAFYLLAGLGALLIGRRPVPLLIYLPFYFTVMNAAALGGLVRYLRRSQTVHWRKAAR